MATSHDETEKYGDANHYCQACLTSAVRPIKAHHHTTGRRSEARFARHLMVVWFESPSEVSA